MRRILALSFVFSLALPAVAHEKEYTMADLQALAESEEWDELLTHCKDVAPKDRKAAWKSLVERAAVGVLEKAKTKSPNEAFGAAYSLVDQYPTLKKSPKFMKLRAEVGIGSIDACFRQSYGVSACIEILDSFLAADKKNGEAHFNAGKIVRLRTTPHASAAPYFAKAMANAPDKGTRAAWCKDEDVKLAVVSALTQPPRWDQVKDAKALVAKHCWTELGDVAFEEFLTGNSYAAQNTCALFRAKKRKLTPLQLAHCKDAKGK